MIGCRHQSVEQDATVTTMIDMSLSQTKQFVKQSASVATCKIISEDSPGSFTAIDGSNSNVSMVITGPLSGPSTVKCSGPAGTVNKWMDYITSKLPTISR